MLLEVPDWPGGRLIPAGSKSFQLKIAFALPRPTKCYEGGNIRHHPEVYWMWQAYD
jgi:hypothetical protein